MKILHVLAQLPSKTGSGIYYTNVVKGLSSEDNACVYGLIPDIEVDFLPIAESNHYAVPFPNQRCAFDLPGMSDVMPYPSTVYSEMSTEMIQQWQQVFSEKVDAAVSDFQPDVILCHHLWFLTTLVSQKYKSHIPIIAFCHGTDLRQAKQHPDLLERYCDVSGVSHIFALSDDQLADISKIYDYPESRLSVLGGGYDPEIFFHSDQVGRESDTIELVFAGKLSRAKGVLELLAVFDQIAPNFPDVHLSLINSANEEMEQIIGEYLNRHRQIKYFNVKNQQILGQVFRQSDLFVLPSYYEGLGLTAIEALASGLLTVTTDIAALQHQLGPAVNQSGAIEYIALPRLFNQDEPYEEDLPAFKERLKEALIRQIERVKSGYRISEGVRSEIEKSAWPALIKKISTQIERTL
ncbi:glycosyltransferase family 4 protein [Vagococcus acidifermentans]|uniref:Glycosyl transferase family 1 n=1 Tax=Vagococcus acidifermentans TaxID=564710 RepID=A0A430AZA5_9ENTE|nr:glycosyltransferase family 4 protein [Vagococcus acidifermentans]RSU13385.1 glycosyl transferase family 1 [Vagococcus acidifermentans]